MTAAASSPAATPLTQPIDLHGQTAIVTGGAMGIGLGIAHRLHEADAAVVVTDLDMDAAERAACALNASIDALHPSMVGLSHYDASKHGAWGFTKNVALELAQCGIWVNAVAHGAIITPGIGVVPADAIKAFEALIPMHRVGDRDDIARATLFLASELASCMTGSQIVVDGWRLLA